MKLIPHICALFFSSLTLGFHVLSAFWFDDGGDENDEEVKRFKMVSIYFFVAGLLTIFAFYFIYSLPLWVSQGVIKELLSTGVHIPFVLIISGTILKIFRFEVEEKKRMLLLITVSICFSFALWNWKLGCISFAIVLGKYIWMDFAIDFKMSRIIDFIKTINVKEISNMVSIAALYCLLYCIAIIIYRIGSWLDKSNDITFLCYALPYIIFGIPVILMRIWLAKCGKN